MRRRRLFMLAAATLGFAGHRAQAQTAPVPLPVSGTLLYNQLYYNHPSYSRPDYRLGGRFAGRVALRVAERTYVGMGVGSWHRILRACSPAQPCDDRVVLESNGEAVVHQMYVQHYPVRRLPAFVRLGGGVARTYTLWPDGSYLQGQFRWRSALSAGGGADVRLTSLLYLTPSLDYTLLPAVGPEGAELRSALAVGLGLTLR